jgi:Kef-type K+ transport system membrane component KefB
MLFLSADVTNLIGISPVFGAFLLGAILSSEREFRTAVFTRLHDLVMVFFLPIFFTYTGLRTDIGSMTNGLLWVLCGLIVLVAFLGKCGGSMIAALLAGVSRPDAFSIGVMMNTRGLMELIVVNIGYELGVIPKSVFFMLVVMAVTTTFMTAPMLRRTLRGVSEGLDTGRDTANLSAQVRAS